MERGDVKNAGELGKKRILVRKASFKRN